MSKQLAQLNITKMKAPLDHPIMKEFNDFLVPVNALADTSPGFVWRLQDENGLSSAHVAPAFGDDMIITNLTLWRDVEALRAFVYSTVHSYFVKNRGRWFEAIDTPKVVLWWVDMGHIPTLEEAKDRLERLTRDGPTAAAFTLGVTFSPKGERFMKAAQR